MFKALGTQLGELVESKQKQYGDSAGTSGKILEILYPQGVPVHAYDNALLITRVLDKLSRIAQQGPNGADLGGESPWQDIAGYALLGTRAAAARQAESETRTLDFANPATYSGTTTVEQVTAPKIRRRRRRRASMTATVMPVAGEPVKRGPGRPPKAPEGV